MKVKTLEKILTVSRHMYECNNFRDIELESIVMFEDQIMLRTSHEHKELTITVKSLEEKNND